MEFKGENAFDYKKQYKLQLIHTYNTKDVGDKKLEKFLVRGSSEKEYYEMN